MQRIVSLSILLGLLIFYGSFQHFAWEERARVRRNSLPGYVLPIEVNRILAVGNKGLLSDYLFLNALTFFGERFSFKQPPSQEDWEYLIHTLDVVTDLDPYFLDPYIFAEGVLVWHAGRIDAANSLLIKGVAKRTWEWRLPFYVGFNYFYFLHDYKQGAEFIMSASEIAGSPSFLITLGARLAYYGDKSKTAALFLKGMLAETTDPNLIELLQKRLNALEAASLIEEALVSYVKDNGTRPENIPLLVDAGYLEELPDDPYGGEWVILESGRVFSTSKFAQQVE